MEIASSIRPASYKNWLWFLPLLTSNLFNLTNNFTVGDVSYSDLCYKPLGEFNKINPREDCATLSVFQWMDNDRSMLDNPTEYIKR